MGCSSILPESRLSDSLCEWRVDRVASCAACASRAYSYNQQHETIVNGCLQRERRRWDLLAT